MPLDILVWSAFAFIVGWSIGALMNPRKVQVVYIPIDELKNMEKELVEREKDPNPYRTPNT